MLPKLPPHWVLIVRISGKPIFESMINRCQDALCVPDQTVKSAPTALFLGQRAGLTQYRSGIPPRKIPVDHTRIEGVAGTQGIDDP